MSASVSRFADTFFPLFTEPMHRLAIISTSKTDWPHDPSSDSSSLAYHLSSIHQRKVIRASAAKEIKEGPKKPVEIPGVYETSETSKLTVLASSLEVEEESGRSSSRESAFLFLSLLFKSQEWPWTSSRRARCCISAEFSLRQLLYPSCSLSLASD